MLHNWAYNMTGSDIISMPFIPLWSCVIPYSYDIVVCTTISYVWYHALMIIMYDTIPLWYQHAYGITAYLISAIASYVWYHILMISELWHYISEDPHWVHSSWLDIPVGCTCFYASSLVVLAVSTKLCDLLCLFVMHYRCSSLVWPSKESEWAGYSLSLLSSKSTLYLSSSLGKHSQLY